VLTPGDASVYDQRYSLINLQGEIFLNRTANLEEVVALLLLDRGTIENGTYLIVKTNVFI
jgi:hypothetical protein